METVSSYVLFASYNSRRQGCKGTCSCWPSEEEDLPQDRSNLIPASLIGTDAPQAKLAISLCCFYQNFPFAENFGEL